MEGIYPNSMDYVPPQGQSVSFTSREKGRIRKPLYRQTLFTIIIVIMIITDIVTLAICTQFSVSSTIITTHAPGFIIIHTTHIFAQPIFYVCVTFLFGSSGMISFLGLSVLVLLDSSRLSRLAMVFISLYFLNVVILNTGVLLSFVNGVLAASSVQWKMGF